MKLFHALDNDGDLVVTKKPEKGPYYGFAGYTNPSQICDIHNFSGYEKADEAEINAWGIGEITDWKEYKA